MEHTQDTKQTLNERTREDVSINFKKGKTGCGL